jgi:Ca2+-binding EF-hand superfamily protein
MRRPAALALVPACLVLAGWLSTVAPEARAGAPAEAAGEVQELVFFGGAQTVLIRLRIEVGERPLGASWRDAVAKLHAHLDSGVAGTAGSEEEPADFARMLRGPLAIRSRPPSDPARDTTFARIDADGDGAIGPDERDRAATVLRRFDQNDDEAVSGAEMMAFQDPNADPPAPEGRGTAEPPVLLLDRGASRIRTVQQVLGRFDTGGRGARAKDQRLARSEIRLAAEVFRAFDANRDGALDSVELMEFLDRGDPAVDLIVRLGPRSPDRPSVVLLDRPPPASRGQPGPAASGSPRVQMRKGIGTMVTIDLGDVRVDVRTEDTSWDAARARQGFDRLFQDIDLDDSKTISLSEARGREPFQGLFRLMDRDGDGLIVKGEMDVALALFEDLWRGHAVLAVKDRGALLFANLDSSGDGRLGLRELHEASGRLATFDRDGDGKVTAAEVPHRFELTLSLAPMPLGSVIRGDATAVAPGAAPGAGPHWFQRMDRNHDGDLSPREFLGPREAFLRLDADGDGLIDAREATAAG